MKRVGDGYLIECSGREIYANNGILGLSDEPGARLTEGYDGSVHEDAKPFSDDKREGLFTAEERAEIAAHMIDVWQRWATLQRIP